MTTLKLNNSLPFLFNNLFNDEVEANLPKSYLKSLPNVNVFENKEGFNLEVAAPGLKKEDFKINFQNNRLTISAKQEETKEEKEGKYTRKEFSFGEFTRTFTLPQSIDGDKIGASYVDGILNISIPKKEEAKEKELKSIEVI